ncbi:MAG: orotate phosphoribosyltransferase [Pseudomonadota bacterium]
MLLEVRAIEFRPSDPFRFSSGWASPVYIDCRSLIAYPRLRRTLMRLGADKICRTIGFERLDTVAGGETAGIPFAAWMADELMLPMAYIRKQAPAHGLGLEIEGAPVAERRVILVEDLTTDGRSKWIFADKIRRAGGEVAHTFVLFFYDIFPGVRERLAEAGLDLHYLTTWHDVLRAARNMNAFDGSSLDEVERFLGDPIGWSAAHGGRSEMPT